MRGILILTCLLLACHARTIQKLYIGQIFIQKLEDKTEIAVGTPLPSWMMIHNGSLVGIPSEKDAGLHTVVIKSNFQKPLALYINVVEEQGTVCGAGKETFWIETCHKRAPTLENKIESGLEMKDMNVRVYNMEYSFNSREQVSIVQEPCPGTYVVVWVVSCTDAFDGSSEFSEFIEWTNVTYSGVKITQGVYKKGVVAVPPLDPTYASKPIIISKIPIFFCIRGEFCDIDIAPSTFLKAEDVRLTLMTPRNVADKWLIKYGNFHLEGVSLNEGISHFTFEAKDRTSRNKEVVTFKIDIITNPPFNSNHRSQIVIDRPARQELISYSSERLHLIKNLAYAMNASTNTITLRDFITTPENKTMIVFSNNTLPDERCDVDGLDQMEQIMIIKERNRTKPEFIRAMGHQFHVRGASLTRFGSCDKESNKSPISQKPIDWVLIFVYIIVFLTILCIILLVVYLLQLKTKKKNHPRTHVVLMSGILEEEEHVQVDGVQRDGSEPHSDERLI